MDLLPGEQVIVGMRKYWFVFFLQTFGLVIVAILPFVFGPFLYAYIPSIALICFAAFAVWLLVLIGFFVMLTKYYLNLLIVTNLRLIDIDQNSLFSHESAAIPLEKIEDVKATVNGVFATLLKFGDLHVQTAADSREILIEGIRGPEYARDVIMQAYGKRPAEERGD